MVPPLNDVETRLIRTTFYLESSSGWEIGDGTSDLFDHVDNNGKDSS